MDTAQTPVIRNDFEDLSERRLVIVDVDALSDGSQTELVLCPDNPKAGAVAFLQLSNGDGGACISLDFEATLALRNALDKLLEEFLATPEGVL
jgi:hypothetical protein